MKPFVCFQRAMRVHVAGLLVCVTLLSGNSQAQKPVVSPDASTYPADVVTSWMALQLKLGRAMPPPVTVRRFAYTGVALYESIVPGLAGYQSIAPQLNGLSALPVITPNVRYYWPASANAALAAMVRNFYAMTSAAQKATIDSLETANAAIYQKDRPSDELARSADFGKQIAAAVFAWSKTDGHDANTPYTVPTGAGLWVPTPPALAQPLLPNLGKCRPLVKDSDAGTDLGLPIVYSEDPTSAYYAQAKEVYDISQRLTPEQRTIALFWADNSWHNILNQVLIAQKAKLGEAAVATTQVSIAMSDAVICIFKGKYRYNAVRPVTYIRNVMKQPDWNALIVTPPHPEYPSGHALVSAAAAQTMTSLFGANYKYTDTPYHLIGFSPRSYNSFEEAAIEASNSRVYGGIHYRKSCDISLTQGKLIAQNIAQKLKFKP